MISVQQIKNILLNQELVDGLFIVEILVKQGNVILVSVDRKEGITIENCKQISRLIENTLDREKEDFELKVSSPGLDQPLKVHEQFLKNIGRKVEVVKADGQKIIGELVNVNKEYIELEYSEKIKVAEKKKKQIVINKVKINFKEIKTTKVVISFK
ncbi:MAG: ribosome assembly cofactor RimP [Chlorobi bacterium]|nr:ribosome assembly cofactor RimP [Chlorobiota bacterium]